MSACQFPLKKQKPARSVSSKNNLPTYPSAHRKWVAILPFLFLALHCVCFLKQQKAHKYVVLENYDDDSSTVWSSCTPVRKSQSENEQAETRREREGAMGMTRRSLRIASIMRWCHESNLCSTLEISGPHPSLLLRYSVGVHENPMHNCCTQMTS